MEDPKHTVIVTGTAGFIGQALISRLAAFGNVVGLDLQESKELPPSASFEPIDLTSDEHVRQALSNVRKRHGGRIASVIHLAAYFDLRAPYAARGLGFALKAKSDFDIDRVETYLIKNKWGTP